MSADVDLETLRDRVEDFDRFASALASFDRLNDEDPNRVKDEEGRDVGYELFYARALFAKTLELDPEASEALLLAARSQHLCRWKMPRADYPMDRAGYLRWRTDLKRYHAAKATETLEQVGYPEDVRRRVRSLNLKQNLRGDPDCQTLEDALCLVFLEKQFGQFRQKTDEEKMLGILRKTWAKMSPKGQQAALRLPMGEAEEALVKKALGEG